MNANAATEFRTALGSFVTGVTIVTTRDEAGQDVGLTANSFNSVSLEPPMILWSLALDSAHLPAFRQAPWWAVHVLASEQEALSARFASRDTARKFSRLKLARGPGDIPLLEGCAARFICTTAFEYEGGDHAIFVGRVASFDRAGRAPLVFHAGRYGRVLAGQTEGGSAADAHFLGHQLGHAQQAVFASVRREYRSRGLSAADYALLTLVGLGDGLPRAELLSRADHASQDRAEATLNELTERNLLTEQGGVIRLGGSGVAILVELIAVAEASQMRIEDHLSRGEVALLRDLLQRLIEA